MLILGKYIYIIIDNISVFGKKSCPKDILDTLYILNKKYISFLLYNFEI